MQGIQITGSSESGEVSGARVRVFVSVRACACACACDCTRACEHARLFYKKQDIQATGPFDSGKVHVCVCACMWVCVSMCMLCDCACACACARCYLLFYKKKDIQATGPFDSGKVHVSTQLAIAEQQHTAALWRQPILYKKKTIRQLKIQIFV